MGKQTSLILYRVLRTLHSLVEMILHRTKLFLKTHVTLVHSVFLLSSVICLPYLVALGLAEIRLILLIHFPRSSESHGIRFCCLIIFFLDTFLG